MKKKDEAQNSSNIFPLAFLIYCLIGVIICFAMAFLFAALAYYDVIPPSFLPLAAYASVFLGVVASSFLSAKKFGKAIYIALAQGVLSLFLFYVSGAVIFARLSPSQVPVGVMISAVSGSLVGGILAALFGKRR